MLHFRFKKLFINMLKADKKQLATTLAVHFGLVGGVAAYTIFGALIMQFLESPERIAEMEKRSVEPIFRNDKYVRVFLGSELSERDPGVHGCLKYVVSNILTKTKCDELAIERTNIAAVDSCYQYAQIRPSTSKDDFRTTTSEPDLEEDEPEVEKWSFGNALIFAFTVITTIGYGHVAPETFYGRLFCIFYGVIGVPLTLLTIANIGMFLSLCLRKIIQLAKFIYRFCTQCCRKSKKRKKKNESEADTLKKSTENCDPNGQEVDDEEEEEESEAGGRKTSESILLGIVFAGYLLFGAWVLSSYEPEMDFFKALYFNFVTLTTIGLGDFVPKSFDYLFITLVYIGIGLALTTMAIEIAADLLRKIHYAGRKIENMANTVVWFGGKKMTMKSLVKNLGDKFNIPEEELANFNMDQFVDNAMKVEAGEIKTLRKPAEEVVFRERAVSYSNLRKSSDSNALQFMDDRMSKTTDMLTLRPETFRTLDTLHLMGKMNSIDRRNAEIPQLELEAQFFTDSSLPTSFEEEYLRSYKKK